MLWIKVKKNNMTFRVVHIYTYWYLFFSANVRLGGKVKYVVRKSISRYLRLQDNRFSVIDSLTVLVLKYQWKYEP